MIKPNMIQCVLAMEIEIKMEMEIKMTQTKALGCMFQCDAASGHDIAFSNQEIKKILIKIKTFYSD